MRAYMKDQFPFLGVAAPVRRAAVAALVKPRLTHDELLAVADGLWQCPEREYRYTAIDLLARHVRSLGPVDVPWLLALAQRDPWWDTVDGLAGVVGDVLLAAPPTGPKTPDAQACMDEALHHPSLWVRRIAMLHQLGWRQRTDVQRLLTCALALGHEREFFIRKAIGWALRDFARTQPATVRAFVEAHATRLSALTVREATKHI
jgi:3-methyladenine DNA glycosylase AlkD